MRAEWRRIVCFIIDERSAVFAKMIADRREERTATGASGPDAYGPVGFIFIAEIAAVHEVTRLFIGRRILEVAVAVARAKKDAWRGKVESPRPFQRTIHW